MRRCVAFAVLAVAFGATGCVQRPARFEVLAREGTACLSALGDALTDSDRSRAMERFGEWRTMKERRGARLGNYYTEAEIRQLADTAVVPWMEAFLRVQMLLQQPQVREALSADELAALDEEFANRGTGAEPAWFRQIREQAKTKMK